MFHLGALGALEPDEYRCAQGRRIYRCYGVSPEAHSEFKRFQRELQILSSALGFPSIVEDGILGPETLARAQLLFPLVTGWSEKARRHLKFVSPSNLDELAAFVATVFWKIDAAEFMVSIGQAHTVQSYVEEGNYFQRRELETTPTVPVSSNGKVYRVAKETLEKLDVDPAIEPELAPLAKNVRRRRRLWGVAALSLTFVTLGGAAYYFKRRSP